jgi:pimeloyl-ACP methyl ester carboxylesterase
MSHEEIRWVEGGSGRLRVSDGGAGEPAVVFVHGLGSDLGAWSAQLRTLRNKRRAVAFDQRGHGSSEPPRDGVYTVDALVDDLHAVVSSLGLERFYLVGHSFSGMVITAYAAAHPAPVAGLVYVDAIGDFKAFPRAAIEQQLRIDDRISADPQLRRRTYEEMLGSAATEATRKRVLAAVDSMDGPAFAALRRSSMDFDAKARIGGYHGPMLAIETDDNAFPGTASRVIPAQRKTLPGVSHWLMMDDPDGFDALLHAFVGV